MSANNTSLRDTPNDGLTDAPGWKPKDSKRRPVYRESNQDAWKRMHGGIKKRAYETRHGMGPRQVARDQAAREAARVQTRPAPVRAPVAVAEPAPAPAPVPAPVAVAAPAPVAAPVPAPVAVAVAEPAPVPVPAPVPAPVPVAAPEFREICRACSKPCDGLKVVFRLGSFLPMCSDYCVQGVKEDGF